MKIDLWMLFFADCVVQQTDSRFVWFSCANIFQLICQYVSIGVFFVAWNWMQSRILTAIYIGHRFVVACQHISIQQNYWWCWYSTPKSSSVSTNRQRLFPLPIKMYARIRSRSKFFCFVFTIITRVLLKPNNFEYSEWFSYVSVYCSKCTWSMVVWQIKRCLFLLFFKFFIMVQWFEINLSITRTLAYIFFLLQ